MSRTIALALLFAVSLPAADPDPREIVAEVQRRDQSDSHRYVGELEVINAKGKVVSKEWEYEQIGSHGASKAILEFTAPAEVKGVALLIHNHPDRSSDQWMWTPSIGRERRIAQQNRSTRFFGTDFSFEDLEERDVEQYNYELLGTETVDGVECWKIRSTPKESKTSQYTSATLWVDKERYVFVKIESFKDDELIRSVEYRDYELVSDIWTARTWEVVDPGRESHTILRLSEIEYDIPIREQDFTIQGLRRGL